MNPALLLEHFDRLADAPDAISRLRRFILDLAVRGKLAEQDPSDEPAAELLRRIGEEKVRLAKVGTIRKQQPAEHVEAVQPFVLPESWRWVRFGEIAEFSAGRTPSRHDFSFWNTGDYAWVSIADMKHDGVVVGTKETVSEKAKHQVFNSEPAPIGTMIMSFKLTIGKISRLGVPAYHNEAIISIHPHLPTMDGYLFKTLPQFSRQGDTKAAIKGSTLNRGSISNLLLPLPPLAEQHRIVAKVDELMALCDRLEAAQTERETWRDILSAASLNRLNQPDADADTFRENARFHLAHLPRLTVRPEQIQQLRQTILSLAVRGKLVEQDSGDEPARVHSALNDQKRQAIAKTDRRADAELQTPLAAEDRWSVPASWEWRSLADLVLFIDYRGHTPHKVEAGVRLITAKNIRKGFINLTPEEFIPYEDYDAWMRRGFPEQGDVLFTTEAPMGNAAVARLAGRFALAQRLICFHPYGATDSDFLLLLLLSEPFQTILDKTATGLTAKGIKAAKLKRLPIAVPPLAEQHRIVAKVDEIVALCDQLETQLATIQAESRRLLEAVLHEALAAAA